MGDIALSHEYENGEENETPARGLLTFCPTRWTVKAACFQRILDNYQALLLEWEICLDKSLASDVRARIIGC